MVFSLFLGKGSAREIPFFSDAENVLYHFWLVIDWYLIYYVFMKCFGRRPDRRCRLRRWSRGCCSFPSATGWWWMYPDRRNMQGQFSWCCHGYSYIQPPNEYSMYFVSKYTGLYRRDLDLSTADLNKNPALWIFGSLTVSAPFPSADTVKFTKTRKNAPRRWAGRIRQLTGTVG